MRGNNQAKEKRWNCVEWKEREEQRGESFLRGQEFISLMFTYPMPRLIRRIQQKHVAETV